MAQIVIITIINTMYNVQELHLYLFSFSAKVILASFTSIFSAHSSSNLSTNYFLHLQFSQSKYSLGLQINPLSQTPLSINSLHSHPHLSLFQRYLLLHFVSFYASCFISS